MVERRLKSLVKSNISKQLVFSQQHRNNIYQAIQREEEKDGAVLQMILQLLVHKKTGFELLQLLQNRGSKKFIEQEGSLYLLLHELEKKEYIFSKWDEGNLKYYEIKQKGRKVLKKLEARQDTTSISLNELLRGDLLYE